MDYTTWNSETNPLHLNPIQPDDPNSYTQPNYTFYFDPQQNSSQNPNNPHPRNNNSNNNNSSINPPGVVDCTYASVVGPTPTAEGLTSAAYYHQDPNLQNWVVTVAQEAVRQYGTAPLGHAAATTLPSNGTEQIGTSIPNYTLWTNPPVWPIVNGTHRKVQKKTKIVQSAYCEVCKVDCNSNDVLQQHKLGKKHMKNLEKLKQAIAPLPSALADSVTPVIGPQENPDNGKAVAGKKVKKRAAESLEDLEIKRRKVLEGGAAATAVRTCTICNVVCNSDIVFKYHLSGQKHTAMVKRTYLPVAGTAAASWK